MMVPSIPFDVVRCRFERVPQFGALMGLVAVTLLLGACGGGGTAPASSGIGGSKPRVVSVEYGRLTDVYGLDASGSVELYLKDVLVGSDIVDQRESNSNIPDDQITYDFLSADPDALQPRLLIPRLIGSADFDDAFTKLGAKLREVTPQKFSSGIVKQSFSVVPRNAAVQVTFTHDLGVDDSFFVERDAQGKVIGLKNTEAVQLLRIIGDPTDEDPNGDFTVIATRIVPRANRLILDPVLLGSEGLQYQTRNNASGLPESADQEGANIRLALATEGPLAIPGLRGDRLGDLDGLNNSGQLSVIRDFRSGNRNDDTPEISQGFVRDSLAPRISGQIVMYLERVDPLDDGTQILTFYKNGVLHEIDRGDTVRLVVDNSGVPAAVSEVTVDPADDRGLPGVQHVQVIVRRQFRTDASGATIDVFEEWDPSDPAQSNTFWQNSPATPAYPAAGPDRDTWLSLHAPQLVLVAEFTAERTDLNGNVFGDDPRYFVTFTPAPLPNANGTPSQPNQNISPFAGAIVRFTKPVDLSTVKALDSFFFGTRDLLDPVERATFMADRGIDPARFVDAKYYTPHLVGAKLFDEDGSQTSIRLQPTMGFYLDDAIRVDEGVSFREKRFKYFLHLLGGAGGIKDLAGNSIDFQSQATVRDNLVIPFSLDTRVGQSGEPLFADNLAVTVARRLEEPDEDENPSYYLNAEVPAPNEPEFNPKAFNLQDVFGPVVYLTDGTMSARPTARVRQVVDDLNQQTPPPQTEESRYCPFSVGGEAQVASPTAGAKFGAPLQNPLNPFGCRLQTVWREVDMSLSRTDPIDFNLDVEQMFWAPFSSFPTVYDEFDRISLFLGHSEKRPEPCVGAFSALPTFTQSGLTNVFADNYAFNVDDSGGTRQQAAPHKAFVDQSMTILPSLAILEPSGVNRFLPLPKFEKPFFVWRDERSEAQGGNSRVGNDTSTSGQNYTPYILSPFLVGRGRFATAVDVNGRLQAKFASGSWDNRGNSQISRTQPDNFTGGLVGAVALPLLADFWTFPDSPNFPIEDPFVAVGVNGWQIALAVQSSPTPAFRAYSAGGVTSAGSQPVVPDQQSKAEGGFQPTGQRTRSTDNSVFWMMTDYVKRMSVVTSGFVEILDPHRMPLPTPEARLGPYLNRALPPGYLPEFAYAFEPPLAELPGGTRVTVEFRGAGEVDTLSSTEGFVGPWAAITNQLYLEEGQEIPNAENFPLDPLKAGDAGIRKYDDRELSGPGTNRNTWTHYYNRNVTSYTDDLNDLADSSFTNQFSGATEFFLAQDVRYFNWRFVFENNVDANPPITPAIDSFIVTYRLEKTN